MNDRHRLTIGLPVYNGEDFLADALESLLGQTYEDFELVISDNASTDNTAEICKKYAEQDSRIRYIRQPFNIGLARNERFVIRQATGELFKLTAHDDLYARDLLKRCVETLDAHPEAVVAHCWEARIDQQSTVVEAMTYKVAASQPRAPERFRSMLFDGWDDYTYGVMRTEVLLRTHLCGSHHMADRSINVELSLYGAFCLVPDWLFFRREHAGLDEAPLSVRERCACLDPRRANKFRHPLIRLYGEYFWSYIAAIARAPLPAAEKQECYRIFTHWLASRARPVVGRTLRRERLPNVWSLADELPDIKVDSVVAGRDRSQS
jgi:glycosyltransferase involved in cell wall biosynthesis